MTQTGNRTPALQNTNWQQNTYITGHKPATEHLHYGHKLATKHNYRTKVPIEHNYRKQTTNRTPSLQDTNWQQNAFITGHKLAKNTLHYRIETGRNTPASQTTDVFARTARHV